MNVNYYQLLVFLLILITVWFLISKFLDKPSGELIIDTSDPEKDKWLIRLYEPTPIAARRHIVKLKVLHRQITEEDKWPYEK